MEESRKNNSEKSDAIVIDKEQSNGVSVDFKNDFNEIADKSLQDKKEKGEYDQDGEWLRNFHHKTLKPLIKFYNTVNQELDAYKAHLQFHESLILLKLDYLQDKSNCVYNIYENCNNTECQMKIPTRCYEAKKQKNFTNTDLTYKKFEKIIQNFLKTEQKESPNVVQGRKLPSENNSLQIDMSKYVGRGSVYDNYIIEEKFKDIFLNVNYVCVWNNCVLSVKEGDTYCKVHTSSKSIPATFFDETTSASEECKFQTFDTVNNLLRTTQQAYRSQMKLLQQYLKLSYKFYDELRQYFKEDDESITASEENMNKILKIAKRLELLQKTNTIQRLTELTHLLFSDKVQTNATASDSE